MHSSIRYFLQATWILETVSQSDNETSINLWDSDIILFSKAPWKKFDRVEKHKRLPTIECLNDALPLFYKDLAGAHNHVIEAHTNIIEYTRDYPPGRNVG